MKINRVAQYTKFALLGIAAGGIGAMITNSELSVKQKINDSKIEILTKDPNRYLRLSKSELEHNSINWTHEAKLMQDSLKNDSSAHREYFEGAQMVRDSIANANEEL